MFLCCSVLGLEDKIGNFEVGKEFDAIYVQPNLARSKFVVLMNHDIIEVSTRLPSNGRLCFTITTNMARPKFVVFVYHDIGRVFVCLQIGL